MTYTCKDQNNTLVRTDYIDFHVRWPYDGPVLLCPSQMRLNTAVSAVTTEHSSLSAYNNYINAARDRQTTCRGNDVGQLFHEGWKRLGSERRARPLKRASAAFTGVRRSRQLASALLLAAHGSKPARLLKS